jgi:Stage II sporulation protein E (SpoIIE)
MFERAVERIGRAGWWSRSEAGVGNTRLLLAAVIGIEVLVALPFVFITPSTLRGVPGPLLIVIALIASLLLGWRLGLVAVAVAVILGIVVIGQNPVATPLIWLPAAVLAGLVGDSMRRAEALRRDVVRQLYAGLVALSRDPVVGPLAIRTRYLPAEVEQVLAGDFYGVLERPNGEAFIMVGDVSGHGPAAAAAATHLRAAWRGLAASTAELSEIALILNDLLHAEQRGGTDTRFATLCMGSFSPDLRTAQFLVAGHPPPLLVFEDECIELGIRRQPPLGVVKTWDWQPQEVPLPDGVWSMLVYTDGLVEGRTAPGGARPFGAPSLCGLLTSGQLPITDAALDEMIDAVQAANGGPMPDDIVAIAVSPAVATPPDGSEQETAAAGRPDRSASPDPR